MTLLLPLGLAIALNVAVLGAGSMWLRRQARRFAAEDKASYRGMFVLKPLPPAGDEVKLLVEDDDGRTSRNRRRLLATPRLGRKPIKGFA